MSLIEIAKEKIMENQVHYLLARSYPVLSSISFTKHKNVKNNDLDTEVLESVNAEILSAFVPLYSKN